MVFLDDPYSFADIVDDQSCPSSSSAVLSNWHKDVVDIHEDKIIADFTCPICTTNLGSFSYNI